MLTHPQRDSLLINWKQEELGGSKLEQNMMILNRENDLRDVTADKSRPPLLLPLLCAC